MRTRLTERDLSRIVKRVINERIEGGHRPGELPKDFLDKWKKGINDEFPEFADWTEEIAKRTQEIADNMVYKVKPGDTLSDIAKKRGTTVDKILKDNPAIKDMNKIFVDQVIIVR